MRVGGGRNIDIQKWERQKIRCREREQDRYIKGENE